MEELQLYFNELYSKNIEKSDYESLIQYLNQLNQALQSIKPEEKMIAYDIFDILIKLQFIYDIKEWYEFCLAIEKSIVCYRNLICFEEMDDLSYYSFAYYYYALGNYKEAYSYAKTCYNMRKKKYSYQDQEMKNAINILLNTLDKLDELSLYYYTLGDYENALYYGKELYEQYRLLFGEKHTKTLSSSKRLALYYQQMGDCM